MNTIWEETRPTVPSAFAVTQCGCTAIWPITRPRSAGEDKAKFDELNAAFLKDVSEVYATPISVQDFLLLSAENRRTPVPGKDTFVDFFHTFENDLEGILWADEQPAPQSEVKP